MLNHGRDKLGEMEDVLAKCFKENKSGLVHPADVVLLGDLGLFNALHLNRINILFFMKLLKDFSL